MCLLKVLLKEREREREDFQKQVDRWSSPPRRPDGRYNRWSADDKWGPENWASSRKLPYKSAVENKENANGYTKKVPIKDLSSPWLSAFKFSVSSALRIFAPYLAAGKKGSKCIDSGCRKRVETEFGERGRSRKDRVSFKSNGSCACK